MEQVLALGVTRGSGQRELELNEISGKYFNYLRPPLGTWDHPGVAQLFPNPNSLEFRVQSPESRVWVWVSWWNFNLQVQSNIQQNTSKNPICCFHRVFIMAHGSTTGSFGFLASRLGKG